MNVAPADIVDFWRDAGYEKWFARNDEFDAEFRRRCETAHHAAARRELEAWMEDAEGALALLILLDQYPRNCFRRSGHAYATDSLARHYAERAVEAGFDRRVDEALRAFFYLPFEHSENLADQERCVALSRDLGGEYLKYAIAHRDAIARFGRFPHRNRELGRSNTPEEQAYLEAGGGFAG